MSNITNLDHHRKGWVCLHRRIMGNPLFRDNPDARHLFMDLLVLAAWDETIQDWNGESITIGRGQVMISTRRLAEMSGLSHQKVRTILKALTRHNIAKINTAPNTPSNTATNTRPSIVTICNFDKYQDTQHSPNTGSNTALNAQLTHKKTKEINTHYARARETVAPDSPEMARQSHLHMQLRAKCVKAANGKLNTKLVDALHDDFANVMDLIAEGISADTIVEAITDRCQRLRPQQVSTWGYLVEAIRDFKHRKDNRFNPKKPSAAHDTPEAQFERMLAAHYRGANP